MDNFGALITTLPGGHKREFALSKTEVPIGRAAASEIALRDSKVSRALLPGFPCAKDQHGEVVDFLRDSRWLPEQFAPDLKNAARFRSELKHRAAVPTVRIFGYRLKMLTGVHVERNSSRTCTKVGVANDNAGDGKVPESSATLEGTEIHSIRQYRGTLHVDNDVRKRLKIDLNR